MVAFILTMGAAAATGAFKSAKTPHQPSRRNVTGVTSGADMLSGKARGDQFVREGKLIEAIQAYEDGMASGKAKEVALAILDQIQQGIHRANQPLDRADLFQVSRALDIYKELNRILSIVEQNLPLLKQYIPDLNIAVQLQEVGSKIERYEQRKISLERAAQGLPPSYEEATALSPH
jgi:hypothetical protein